METAQVVTDGRGLRSIRTRTAIIDALLELLRAGDPSPTSRQIAELAGISVRSVFLHFVDVEEIFASAAVRHFELHAPLWEAIPLDGTLDDRIATLVSRRIELYSAVAPIRRAGLLRQHESPNLRLMMNAARQANFDDMGRIFAAEFGRVASPLRRDLQAALDVATCFSTWDQLDRSGLSSQRIDATLRLLLRSLLA